MPLKDSLVKLLLEGIQTDREGGAPPNLTDIIRGVIQSFVGVEEYRRKSNPEVSLLYHYFTESISNVHDIKYRFLLPLVA